MNEDSAEGVVDKATRDRADARGPFGRMLLFFRQIIAELKKVTTPTRKELQNYFLVVLVFVVIMMAIISLLDTGFGTLVMWVFAGGSANS